MNTTKTKFRLDYTQTPPVCLPADLDMTDLIDMTSMTDRWRVYFNTQTNEHHIGARYFAELEKMRE